jgi:hypothetical protein
MAINATELCLTEGYIDVTAISQRSGVATAHGVGSWFLLQPFADRIVALCP